MYSAAVLDHFRNPRNAGELPHPSASAEVSNPVCGDVLRLAIRVEGGKIAAVRFKAQGCVTAMACSSLLTEMVAGKSLQEAKSISAANISDALGGLPQATFHGAQLAADAFAAILVQVWPGECGTEKI